MENFCISVDWLQTFCLGEPLENGTYEHEGAVFTVTRENYETPQFTRVLTVQYQRIHFATIQQQPRTSVINRRATLVKLENRFLYSQGYIDLLYKLQAALNLIYKGITRLDLAYDCNHLRDGRNVERFIKQFITAEAGTVGHIVRKGSARFSLHGTRKQTSAAKFNSIRFGSPRNKIQAYCYDKTLELAEVKDKPWIRKMWEENGLRYFVDRDRLSGMSKEEYARRLENEGFSDYVGDRVWRFEISISSQGQDILNMSTGELFRLSPKYLEHYENIRKLFYIYAEKVFNFRINTGQKNIRNYPRLQIFEETPAITSKPFYVNRDADTGRMEKICYNKLRRLSEEYTDLAEYRRQALLGAMEFLQELSGKKSATVRLERYIHYLDELKGHKFIAEDDLLYFAAMDRLAEKKRDFDADELYYLFKYYKPIDPDDFQPDTPPDYIW